MVNKLRRLCEKKSFTCKKNRSATFLNYSSHVGTETGIFITFCLLYTEP